MLKWEIKKNVITEIVLDGNNLINPWGIETADSFAFFSLEEGIGYRYHVIEEKFNAGEKEYTSLSHVKMREGEWKLNTKDELEGNKIIRTAELLCVEDSIFMDFVVRFRFKKEHFNEAQINGKKIIHTKSNVYHQYEVDKAQLTGADYQVNVRTTYSDCAGKFRPHLYVRDHQDEWVIHARMIPNSSHKNVIKLCSRYFKTMPLPQFITNFILLSDKLKSYLWYRSEHLPYKNRIMKFFSPNAFPMIKLQKGQSLKWRVEVEIDRR
jgi:hypothetical protein